MQRPPTALEILCNVATAASPPTPLHPSMQAPPPPPHPQSFPTTPTLPITSSPIPIPTRRLSSSAPPLCISSVVTPPDTIHDTFDDNLSRIHSAPTFSLPLLSAHSPTVRPLPFSPSQQPPRRSRGPRGKQPGRRDTYTRFTAEEEAMLLDGVRVFGVGNWKKILNSYRFHWKRTAVDLKDKYRNITRAKLRKMNALSVDPEPPISIPSGAPPPVPSPHQVAGSPVSTSSTVADTEKTTLD